MTEVIAYTLSVIKGHCGVTAGESSDLSLGRTANSEIVRLAGSQTLSEACYERLSPLATRASKSLSRSRVSRPTFTTGSLRW
jgi:hypothetical protein